MYVEDKTELYKEFDDFLKANADRIAEELGLVDKDDYKDVPYVIELKR